MNVERYAALAKMALPALVLAFALPALAVDVTFSTTGAFTCGSAVGCTATGGVSSVATIINDGNTATLSASGDLASNLGLDQVFDAKGDSYVNLPLNVGPNITDVDIISLGDTSTSNGPSVGHGPVDISGAQFTLYIKQTAPQAVNGSLSGSITGTVYYQGTSAAVNFGAGAQITLGQITYYLDDPTDWQLPNPGHNGPNAETFTSGITPEPTFMMLTGLGFAGLAFVAYRRWLAV